MTSIQLRELFKSWIGGFEGKYGSEKGLIMADLMERMGGEAGISGFIDALYATMSQNSELAKYMTGVNPDNFKTYMKQWWMHAADPAHPYTGRPLHVVHTGLHITDSELDLVKTISADIARQYGMSEDLVTATGMIIEGQRQNITNL